MNSMVITSKNSLLKTVLLTFLFILFSFQIVSGKEPPLYTNLKKITFFKSTRQDVEKLFKYESFKEVLNYNYRDWLYSEDEIEDVKKNPVGYYTVYYTFKDGSIDVTYSKGKCSENNKEGYDVEKDVVIDSYLFLFDAVKISKLNLNLSKFIKTELHSDVIGEMDYDSKDLGIHISTGGKWTRSIQFSPLPFQVEKYGCQKFTADVEMERIFIEKRSIFEKLVQMSDQDREVKVITNKSTEPLTEANNDPYQIARPLSFSKQRWNSYKQLFKETELKYGLMRADDQEPKGIFFRREFNNNASADKGYFYTKVTPNPLVESIDAIIEPLKSGDEAAKEFFKKEHRFYKRIADNWYLYYDYQ